MARRAPEQEEEDSIEPESTATVSPRKSGWKNFENLRVGSH
jgi:hypothetical protein